MRHTSRDNSRTPMQWDNSTNGGFTSAPKPWLAENPNYTQINAASEVAHPDSVYNYTSKLIAFRHNDPALIYGDYKDLDPQNPHIFTYTRTLGPKRFLVVMNFSRNAITYTVPSGIKAGHITISNLGATEENTSTLNLKPWEARIYTY